MNKEFELLVDKCAKRLAEGKKPHRVTLNKMYQYPGTTAEYRIKRLDERYKHFRNEYLTRQAELQAMFARAMSGTRNWETIGEPVEHDIKFIK
jgi:predicted  nucleic acid-binding Zn-ribbon protein